VVEIYGKHFIYNDIYSSKYGLIIATVDTQRMVAVSGRKEGSFVYNRALKRRHLIGDDYQNSSLSFEIDIVTCDGHALTLQEVREAEKWLFVDSTFKKLYIDPADDEFGETYELVYGVQKYLYFNCRFLYAEKLEYNGGVVGWRCTLETDSLLMWQDQCGVTYDLTIPVYVYEQGEQKRLLRGDVDFDGWVTAYDASMVLTEFTMIMAGYPPSFTAEQQAVADMDGDGEITAYDATMILKMFTMDIIGYPSEYEWITFDDGRPPIEVVTGTEVCEADVDSDIDGYTYPTITIYSGIVGGTIKLWNYDDDENRITEFQNVGASQMIVIDSSVSMISSNAEEPDALSVRSAMYEKMTKRNFPRLVNGLNRLGVSGDVARVSIAWNNRRYM
jgi:hypothetical protein